MVGKTVRAFLPKVDLLPYLEAILRVYNLNGRRDNKYKARIKILVHETGTEEITAMIEEAFLEQKKHFKAPPEELVAQLEAAFAPPLFNNTQSLAFEQAQANDPVFRSFVETNVTEHKNPAYGIVSVSLKAVGATPGDATSDQMRALAQIAKRYAHDELRVSHEQNIILPHVRKADIPAVHAELKKAGLATANIGLLSDIIACPGMDYCALATARSIPIAQEIAVRFDELKLEREIGPLKIKISGCINACGHHHVGHIGILGLDKAGVENYQITLGGDGTETATIGERTGPGFAADDLIPAIEAIISTYLEHRLEPEETFLAAYRRLGAEPFKAAIYVKEDDNVAA
jgi:sulfite reductase (NADPH) hemoprotein beta-component